MGRATAGEGKRGGRHGRDEKGEGRSRGGERSSSASRLGAVASHHEVLRADLRAKQVHPAEEGTLAVLAPEAGDDRLAKVGPEAVLIPAARRGLRWARRRAGETRGGAERTRERGRRAGRGGAGRKGGRGAGALTAAR